jgi:lambda family phage portal protein
MGLGSRLRAAWSGLTGVQAVVPTSPYLSGAQGRRTQNWYAPSTGPTSVVMASGETLRNRCRELARNNPYARSAIDSVAANAIGTGIMPRPATDDEAFNQAAAELWERSCGELDPGGTTNGYGLQSLGCRETVEAGEVLYRIRSRRLSDGYAVPMQLQILEPEHLPLWKNEVNPKTGNQIVGGIERDALGRPVTYHLYREHPGEFMSSGRSSDLTAVDAEEILHVFKPLRAGQGRGEPWLAAVALRLYDLDEYVDAELTRKKGAAMFVGSIETPDLEKASGALGPASGTATSGVQDVAIEPGSFPVLPVGTTINWNSPADVGPNYLAFQQDMLRAIAAGVGLTYEMLTGDLSQVNYSSIRAGQLEFRRRCEAFQWGVWVHQFCEPFWHAWLDRALLAGALPMPRDYSTNPLRWHKVTWHTQGWRWVDPVKEVAAYREALDGQMTSLTRIAAEQGEDIREILKELAAEQQMRADLGLPTPSLKAAAPSGASPAALPDEPAPQRTGTDG